MSSRGSTSVAKCFSGNEIKCIMKSENEQNKFKEWVMGSNEFSEREKKAIQCNTLADFKENWAKNIESKPELQSSHENGVGLGSKRHQTFTAVAQSFMDDFSPLIQIVKEFGAPYGVAALGILSVLLVVANNKDKTEGNLKAAISGIRDRLPGRKLYQHIYNDDHELDVKLQTNIVSVYEKLVEFSVAATRHYKIGGPRRFMRALSGLDTLKTKADEVQGVIVDLRHVFEEVLDKNVDSMKCLNLQQAAAIRKLETQVEQLQARSDHTRLIEVQNLLRLGKISEGQRTIDIQKYRQTLDDSLDAGQFEQMRDDRLRTFEKSPNYRTWSESKSACLLILSGYNERSILDEDQCWLSPIALNRIEDLSHPENAVIIAHYLLPQQRQTVIHDVLPTVLLQLLSQKCQALRDEEEFAELCAELRQYEDLSTSTGISDANEEARISTLQKIALRVVNFFAESEAVYIIVDRIDRCTYPGKADHRRALTKALVKMVEGAKCNLKILAVINGYDWRVEDIRDDFGAEKEGTLIIHTERQSRLDSES